MWAAINAVLLMWMLLLLKLKDVERSLMKKHPGYKQRLSTMEEYDMDDGAQGMDERRYRTY